MRHYHILWIVTLICSSLSGYAQVLETLIGEALEQNPEIRKVELQYRIASEKVNEGNTLPNTEFGAGYFVSEPETRTGAQRFKLSVKQMLPWFGSITAREQYSTAMADATYIDLVIAKRKVMVAVAQSYYVLYANKAKQKVLTENIALLETYETLALTSVEVGKASAVDVLRLQMRQNELEQSKAILEQQFRAEQVVMNKLLNRETQKEIDLSAILLMPEADPVQDTTGLALHPELLKYDALYRSVEELEALNQKERNPMIGFGLDYIAVDERPDMSFSDNGKDILMPMVSVSIPIFNNSYSSRTRQNTLRQEEITSQKQERRNDLESRLASAISDRASARITYRTQSKNLEQAANAEEILMKNYETGTIDFIDVLDIQELQLKFQINRIEALKDYYMQTVIMNYLTE